MKRYVALLTTMLCLLIVFGVDTRAGEICGKYTYVINKDGTAKVTGYYGDGTDLKIPSIMNKKKVTAIGSYVFNGKTKITSVIIPEGVISIGKHAFDGATQLKTVRLPQSLQTLGKYVFKDCKKLSTVDIPSGVTKIPDYAFYNCVGLTTISLPSTLKSIGSYAFFSCKGFTSFVIPATVTTIKEYAFNQCTGLTDMNIPAKVKSLNEGVFGNCSNLRTITIAKKVKFNGNVFGINDGKLVIYGYSGSPAEEYAQYWNISFVLLDPMPNIGSVHKVDGSRYTVTSDTTVTYKRPVSKGVRIMHIPEYVIIKSRTYAVTAINYKAFYKCKSLRAVVIPAQVRQIGPKAFAGCKKLKRVYIVSRYLRKYTIGLSAFKKIHKKATFYVPADLTKAYKRVLRKRGAGKKIKVKGL